MSSDPIKAGDQLAAKVSGVEIPAVAVTDEAADGSVQVKHAGGHSPMNVSDLRRLDETGPPCPECGKPSRFIPPNEMDRQRGEVIVKYRCKDGHDWQARYPSKMKG